MCLIIHRPARAGHLPDDIIAHNRNLNPDGFGIAWREGKTLRYEKFGPAMYEAFYARLKDIDGRSRTEYVAHFRRATHGPACTELAHPFPYQDAKVGEVLVFHNGIINISTDKNESDTSRFVKSVLAKLEPRWWTLSHARFLVEAATDSSRMLLMTAKETIRLNGGDWKKINGIFYSVSPYTGSSTGYSYGGKGGWDDDQWGSDYRNWNHWTPPKGKDDEPDEESPKAVALLAAPSPGWDQQGHHVTPTSSEDDSDGDKTGTAICDVCRTIGEYYVIQGSVYVDVKHISPDASVMQRSN